MYENGYGVLQDYIRAHMWYNIAASSGNKMASKNRDIVAKRMSPAQLAKAQQLARNFVPKKHSPTITAKKPSPKVTSKPTSRDLETRLLRLKELEKNGLITKEEAQQKRKKLLNEL